MRDSKSIYVGLQEHLYGTPRAWGVRGEARFPPFKDISSNKNIDIKW